MGENLGASTSNLGGVRATATQTALTTLVAQFAERWHSSSEPPNLSVHLPTEPALRRTVLIELIKLDMHERWSRSDDALRLADYREQFPELGTAPLPPDLIYKEISARSRRNDVDLTEYQHDYPTQMARITESFDRSGPRTTLLADPTALDAIDTIAPGATIDDFDLLLPLGRGAFARVFLARQRSMGRLVAVKISHDRGTEPQTLAQLDHDHIVRVFDQRQITEQHLKLMYIWILAMGIFLVKLLSLGPLPAGLLANLIASSLIAAAAAVVYTYFPATFFVLRWYWLPPGTPIPTTRPGYTG
ncbi:hypothetical protein [Nocardia sp. NBC_01009]|uniref:hypothetical protein n=1 Tax=Nocardia sp. NBC_01009 TaxID=2975996 RepID=UPI00386EB8FC